MQANIIQERLRKIYDKYKLLPPINSHMSSDVNDKEKENDLQLKPLLCCYRELPWYSETIEQLMSYESNGKLDDVTDNRSKTITRKPFLFDQDEIERKYRNFDSKSLELNPSDFSLEYRHRIKKLKDFQSLLTGQTNMLVKDRDFMDKLESEINKRNDAQIRDQFQSLLAKDAMRDRFSKIKYSETYIDVERDRKRKMPSNLYYTAPRQSSDNMNWRSSKSMSLSESEHLPELAPTTKLIHSFTSTHALKPSQSFESVNSFGTLPQILSPKLSKVHEEAEEFINAAIVIFEEPFVKDIAKHLSTVKEQILERETKSLDKPQPKKEECYRMSSIVTTGCCKKICSKKV